MQRASAELNYLTLTKGFWRSFFSQLPVHFNSDAVFKNENSLFRIMTNTDTISIEALSYNNVQIVIIFLIVTFIIIITASVTRIAMTIVIVIVITFVVTIIVFIIIVIRIIIVESTITTTIITVFNIITITNIGLFKP